MEKQSPSALTKWKVSKLIVNNQIGVHQPDRQMASLPLKFLLLQLVDKLDCGKISDASIVMLDWSRMQS